MAVNQSTASAPSPGRRIDLIVVHCADVPNGRWTTVEDIDGWHAARGFRRDPRLIGHNQPQLKSIGYHFVIYTTGSVATGRGLDEVGAHVAGHNERSIGVCLIGRDAFSPLQWASLQSNVAGLLQRFPGAKVRGHRELNPAKTCPGFDVQEWLAGGMRMLIDHIHEAGNA